MAAYPFAEMKSDITFFYGLIRIELMGNVAY